MNWHDFFFDFSLIFILFHLPRLRLRPSRYRLGDCTWSSGWRSPIFREQYIIRRIFPWPEVSRLEIISSPLIDWPASPSLCLRMFSLTLAMVYIRLKSGSGLPIVCVTGKRASNHITSWTLLIETFYLTSLFFKENMIRPSTTSIFIMSSLLYSIGLCETHVIVSHILVTSVPYADMCRSTDELF